MISPTQVEGEPLSKHPLDFISATMPPGDLREGLGWTFPVSRGGKAMFHHVWWCIPVPWHPGVPRQKGCKF